MRNLLVLRMFAGFALVAVLLLPYMSWAAATAKQLHAEALRLYSAGDYNGSIDKWKQELKLVPGNKQAMRDIGLAYESLKQYKDAEKWFRDTLAVDPNFDKAHYGLGRVLMAQERYPEAEKEFKTVLMISPNFHEIHNKLGSVYFMQGKQDQAKDEYYKDLADAKSTFRTLSYQNLFFLSVRLAERRKYKESSEVLAALGKYRVIDGNNMENYYDFDKWLISSYKTTFENGEYDRLAGNLENLPRDFGSGKGLRQFADRTLAYCYLLAGKWDKAADATVRLARSARGKEKDKLKGLLRELKSEKPIVTTAPKELPRASKVTIHEYDLGIPASEKSLSSVFAYSRKDYSGLTRGSMRSRKRHRTDYVEDELARINREIAPLGFRLIDTSAIKPEEMRNEHYDLFKDGKLAVPGLSMPFAFSRSGKRFIFLADKYRGQDTPSRGVVVDTGSVRDNPYFVTDYYPMLVGGRLVEIWPFGSKKDKVCHQVKEGDKVLYESSHDVMTMEWLVNFFVHDGHWILEHCPNTVVVDGKSLNEKLGAAEVLNYHYLRGRLFYLFTDKSGKFRVSIDNKTLPQKYDNVHGYSCCEEAMFDPSNHEDYTSYYATKGDKWYYVEAVAE
ncbi:MAG: tetratricopeptide repeat protein [Nitrospirae bacterium]|nr:tetratricopeptide repeat protein [Nitrospirota bacterium]